VFWQAYHDMATYDAATGTGGLDGSIQYEVDRPEVSFVLLHERENQP
jgi:hypothetical protein